MTTLRRLRLLAASVALIALGAASAAGVSGPPSPTITVYKSPTCGCCNKWVDHMRAAGFKVVTEDMDDLTETKATLGVKPNLASCHTAVVDGYVIEGHVPADLVQRLLEERPKVAGLAVPGMPMGSPGMEMGGEKDPYQVLTFDKQGKTAVYAKR